MLPDRAAVFSALGSVWLCSGLRVALCLWLYASHGLAAAGAEVVLCGEGERERGEPGAELASRPSPEDRGSYHSTGHQGAPHTPAAVVVAAYVLMALVWGMFTVFPQLLKHIS